MAQDLTFKDVIAGSGFMVGLTEDGIAYAWGDADRTLLGIESTDTSGRVESPERVAGDHRFAQIYAGTTGRSVPTRIGGALRFERICAGGFEVYAIEADTGRLYEWGMLDRAYNVNDLYVTEPRLSNSRSRASTSRATSPSRRAGACAPS